MAEGPDVSKARAYAEAISGRRGWRLNPVAEDLGSIVHGLAVNHDRYGYYLCPCREGWGERAKDGDVICPCRYASSDIDEHGHCFCGLFLSPGFHATGQEVEPIPERRPLDRMP